MRVRVIHHSTALGAKQQRMAKKIKQVMEKRSKRVMMMRVMMTLIRLQKDAPSPSLQTTHHFVFRVTGLLPVCLSNWKHPILSLKRGFY